MHLIPFYVIEPIVAPAETRVMNTLIEEDGLPVGSYGLFEFYCPDPTCDCRRVMINVVEEKQPERFLASISFAFDRDDDMAGPFLDPLNPQSRHAEKLLELIEEVVLSDADYVARLERHYDMVKQAASDPKHPAYVRLQRLIAEDEAGLPIPRLAKETKRVRRNDPCPCGSGKKYKHCCMRKEGR